LGLNHGKEEAPLAEEDPKHPAQKAQHVFSDFFYNVITYIGVVIAFFVCIAELFLFVIEFFSDGSNVYFGIVTYIFLPVFFILGLILIPIGALWKRHCVLKGLSLAKPKSIFIDPSIPTHRNAIFIFIIGTTIFLIMTAVGSYKAFHYTESVNFCGLTCHHVMKPEHTAYLNSAHARVKCVECHIGEGADWYVRAKLSGVRQVYHAIKGDYSRPIATPVHNLRPAKETCERCHWTDKFYSSFEINKTYFPTDESEHSKWLLRMLVNVGSSKNTQEGIHNHMYLDNDIYFAAEDERLQNITWVKNIDKDGKETVYISSDSKWKEEAPPENMMHKMDCMDCHNRPTHNFNPPNELINKALASGEIAPELALIKPKAMELMSKEYKTEEEAINTIRQSLDKYLRKKLGDRYALQKDKVTKAIEKVVALYQVNMFPEMKARWDAFPDNIGHLVSSGCFRCHDGDHESSSGQVITKDCTVCHSIIEQGSPNALETDTKGLPFVHPFEDDGLWQDMSCTDCHTGN